MKRAFQIVDEAFYNEVRDYAVKCGAAGCIVLLIGNRVYSANVGDSRAVLCRNGFAMNLTNDHKTVSFIRFSKILYSPDRMR